MEKYLSVRQVMEVLGIGRNTAYELIHRADFPSARIGKRVVVSETALKEWLDKGGTDQQGA